MNRVRILDCTLRDGGYINDFRFGDTVIKDIVAKLSKASIDIIECGFLQSGAFDRDKSLYGSVSAIKHHIGVKNKNLMYVAMIQYGGISNEEIEPYDGDSVDGIRVTFHEHEIDDAFVLGRQLMDKGYQVFMQPVGTVTYTDEALLRLIARINTLKPYAFYIVDTLGTMYKNDLLRMFYLVDHNLDKKIAVGFHSHNNLQLSFANAQELMQLNTPRRLIIDASVYGMGRGAGNLHTELVTQYINANFGLQYDNLEILEIIDGHIRPLSLRYTWGYDAAYYIASITGCHPNYASFLLNKQTLHVQDIYSILNNLSPERRALFDKAYIGEEYLQHMSRRVDDRASQEELAAMIGGKKVLLLAPGKSLGSHTEMLRSLVASGEYVTVSVNFIPTDIPVDIAFISNMKRFRNVYELAGYSVKNIKVIVTSNIDTSGCEGVSVIDYSSFINEEQCIADNAGLMCMNLLKKVGAAQLLLAGFDGFAENRRDNYFNESMLVDVETERLQRINIATTAKISQLRTQMEISFLTASVYQSEGRA